MKNKEVCHHNSISYGHLENFELRELKLFLALLVDVKEEKLEYNYSSKEIKKFIHMGRDTYKVFEKVIGELQRRRIIIPIDNNIYETYNIFSKLKFNNKTQEVDVVYNPLFFPFISNLKNNFCKYKLKNIENLSSKYSIIFYIRGKADLFKGKFCLSFDEVLKICGAKYTASKIDLRVLNPAIEEINAYTDLSISVEKMYQAQQRGRSKLVGYTFHVSKKEIPVSLELQDAIEKAKKNIYISKSKVLNKDTIQMLLDEMSEEELILGLKYAYTKINREFSALEYLRKVILSKNEENVVEEIVAIKEVEIKEDKIDIMEKFNSLDEYDRLKVEEKALKSLCSVENVDILEMLEIKEKSPNKYWSKLKNYIELDIGTI